MGLQTRVPDSFDPLVLREHVSHLGGVGLMSVHANGERSDPAHDQVAVQRTGYRSHRVLKELEARREFRIIRDEHPADGVGVSPEVLRRGMHHDVGAERERRLQVGRGERVVDHELRVVAMGHVGQRRDVGDP